MGMKMALHCATSQMSLSQLDNLNQQFKHYDSSGDGRLSLVEVRQLLEDSGFARGDDLELIIESLDSDSSGMVEYSEFIAGCLSVASEGVKKQLRAVFDIFDLDGSGTISLE